MVGRRPDKRSQWLRVRERSRDGLRTSECHTKYQNRGYQGFHAAIANDLIESRCAFLPRSGARAEV
jgi:hypothetical protein